MFVSLKLLKWPTSTEETQAHTEETQAHTEETQAHTEETQAHTEETQLELDTARSRHTPTGHKQDTVPDSLDSRSSFACSSKHPPQHTHTHRPQSQT